MLNWWLIMNKNGALIGNSVVLYYAFIVLTFIIIIFSLVFIVLSGEFIPGTKTPGFFVDTEKNIPKIDYYDFLNYFLYTRINVDGKETNLLELIPLYCYEKKQEQAENIRQISQIFFPYLTGRALSCINEKITCKDIPNEVNSLGENLYFRNKGLILFNEISSFDLKRIEIPGFKENSKACLEFEQKKYDPKRFIDIAYSEKEFEKKVKEKSVFKNIPDKSSFLISPTKDIWRYNNNMWCNALKETDSFLNCQKGISTQDLINCKGDYYQLCTK